MVIAVIHEKTLVLYTFYLLNRLSTNGIHIFNDLT